jgi:magnesium-transporting ATPase (P-type)
MRNDSSENDPRTIWQNQPTEPSIMTLEKIRQKTQELHAKTLRQMIGNSIMPLAVFAFYGYGIAKFSNPARRTIFACAIAWSLAGQYFLNRGMWSAMLPGDAALSTGIESYRREVERQRSLFGRFMLWQFGPLMFAIATLILLILTLGIGNRGMPLDGAILKEALLKMTPFLTLMVIWIVSFFVIRMRAQRQLQREIDELNEIERANR